MIQMQLLCGSTFSLRGSTWRSYKVRIQGLKRKVLCMDTILRTEKSKQSIQQRLELVSNGGKMGEKL